VRSWKCIWLLSLFVDFGTQISTLFLGKIGILKATIQKKFALVRNTAMSENENVTPETETTDELLN